MKKKTNNIFNLNKLPEKIALGVLILWSLLSVARTFFNITKIYTEEKSWMHLSDEEKRVKIFREAHLFLTFVQENTIQNSSMILFLPHPNFDNRLFYLSLYCLYPRKIQLVQNARQL